MATKTHDVKRAIIAIIDARGEAAPREIAEALGGEWCSVAKQTLLRQMLRQMIRARLLQSVRYGVYRLSPSHRSRSFDVRDRTETDIARFLRDNGGVATTRDIHAAVGSRPLGGRDRGYSHRRITLALKESALFRQDHGRGYWNLVDDGIGTLPPVN
jgi:hypothetical protein